MDNSPSSKKFRSENAPQTDGAPPPAALEDSSPGLQIPAREHEEYQQWYETGKASQKLSVRKFFHDLWNPADSSAVSGVILFLVTVCAVFGGIVAIRFLPESSNPSYPTEAKMQLYKKVPPGLLAYQQEDSFALPLKIPTCLASDEEDRVYVGGDRKLMIFSDTGEELFSMDLEYTPSCLAIPKSEQLFEKHLVVGFPSGFQVFAPQEEGFFSQEPVFHRDLPGSSPHLKRIQPSRDSFLLADASEKIVYRMNGTGKILQSIGRRSGEKNEDSPKEESNAEHTGGEFPGFSIPNLPFLDVVELSRDNLLCITNPGKHRIEVFSSSGEWKPESGWGTSSPFYEGFSGCCNPSSLVLLEDGRFATVEKYIPRIKVFDPSGTLLSFIATPEDLENPPTRLKDAHTGEPVHLPFQVPPDQGNPPQIAFSTEGRVYVLDTTYKVLRTYSEK